MNARHAAPREHGLRAHTDPRATSSARASRATGSRWEHVELMRKIWKGKLVLKGVLSPEDVRIARESGVDGLMISNHGGRQLDGTVAPVRMLPAVKRRSRQHGDHDGQRHPPRHRRAEGARARRAISSSSAGRSSTPRRSRAKPACATRVKLLREEIDRDMAMLGIIVRRRDEARAAGAGRGPSKDEGDEG